MNLTTAALLLQLRAARCVQCCWWRPPSLPTCRPHPQSPDRADSGCPAVSSQPQHRAHQNHHIMRVAPALHARSTAPLELRGAAMQIGITIARLSWEWLPCSGMPTSLRRAAPQSRAIAGVHSSCSTPPYPVALQGQYAARLPSTLAMTGSAGSSPATCSGSPGKD